MSIKDKESTLEQNPLPCPYGCARFCRKDKAAGEVKWRVEAGIINPDDEGRRVTDEQAKYPECNYNY